MKASAVIDAGDFTESDAAESLTWRSYLFVYVLIATAAGVDNKTKNW
jgi:hypothetical protein